MLLHFPSDEKFAKNADSVRATGSTRFGLDDGKIPIFAPYIGCIEADPSSANPVRAFSTLGTISTVAFTDNPFGDLKTFTSPNGSTARDS